MRKIRTPEERVAKALGNLVGDVSLDLDEIGIHLATNLPNVLYRRLSEVLESADEQKEKNVRRIGNASHYISE
jgi:hypothetical protein